MASLLDTPDALRDVTSPWIFTAGSIRPARGLLDAIAALAQLEPSVRLVIAGEADPSMHPHERALRRRAEELGVSARIVWAGRLRPDQMAWCYRHCSVFLTTTRAEACPNTALEALFHGCSIIATGDEPMPEFLGDVARYYSRGQVGSLVRMLAPMA